MKMNRCIFGAFLLIVWTCFLLIPLPAAGEGAWTMKEKDGSFFVTLKDHPGLELHLFTHGGYPEVLAFSPSHVRPDVWLLIYYAGSAGTSNMAVIYDAYVIDVRNSRVLGNAPWKIDGYPSYGFSQPVWLWEYDKIIISGIDSQGKIIQLPKSLEGSDE